ncbi:XRE family transcriptional regulator [bacterium]|nr:XRE family transcriptional regulator [bacterium]QQR58785.1 MAG: XRE family transcriptional regulator [Candidatus Melainabacteria bacterium]
MPRNKYTKGSGNIFEDLGFSKEQASELEMKSYLFDFLQNVVNKELESINQSELAKNLGVDQPIISKIINDKMSIFSVEKIIQLILKLHYDIQIEMKPAPRKRQGQVHLLTNLKSA